VLVPAFVRHSGIGYSGAEPPTANERYQLYTERIKKYRAINARVGFRSLSVLQVNCRKVRRLGSSKNGSISMTYEFRTKSAQSGGLENNGCTERISGLGGSVAVRRFVCEARGYWASMGAHKPAENVGHGQTGGA